MHPTSVHITAVLVEYTTRTDRTNRGVATSWLKRMQQLMQAGVCQCVCVPLSQPVMSASLFCYIVCCRRPGSAGPNLRAPLQPASALPLHQASHHGGAWHRPRSLQRLHSGESCHQAGWSVCRLWSGPTSHLLCMYYTSHYFIIAMCS